MGRLIVANRRGHQVLEWPDTDTEEARQQIALAHGRTSSYVRSDIGAIPPGRWQLWQERWRTGATSLVNVTCAPGAACPAASACCVVKIPNATRPANRPGNIR